MTTPPAPAPVSRPVAAARVPDGGLIPEAYTAVTARRNAFDLMMWQVPALAMTAQAFLLTIALGPDSATAARLVTATLALALSGMSMQLMAKHRFLEIIDSRLSERFEVEMGVDRLTGVAPHGRITERFKAGGRTPPWWIRLSSYRLWQGGLLLFAIADATTVVITLVRPSWLGS